jgi:hypothetical protein
MARARTDRASALAFDAITVEGALISPAVLARIAQHQAGGQTDADYGIPKGLTLRDDIARYFRIGQANFKDLMVTETPSAAATVNFAEKLLHDVFGFADIRRVGTRTVGDRQFTVTLEGLGGRVPAVVVPPADDLDRPSTHLTTDGRRRSAASALQDWLNAGEIALRGLCSNGVRLRLVRNNASFTRPAYVEADLRRIFEGDAFADFAVLWLLIHSSRFGIAGTPPFDCALERWRDAGQKEGVTARDKLRDGVEAALLSLGNGFLSHPNNAALREKLHSGALPLPELFSQLLRFVYRLIFLLAAEDRNLLHPPDTAAGPRRLYAEGYSVGALRDRAVRRSAWDRHHDRWEGLLITFIALARGEKRLGLPALGGLFAPDVITNLEGARLTNRNLMEAIFRLAWLREPSGLVPVNWRDMETEELGSVYESLLELTPQLTNSGHGFAFAKGGEAMGNARKSSGSYYTPDGLVQALLDSTLNPVLGRAEAETDDPAAALLSVTVLDPACGSGHFLLAAARRIATRVARSRTGGVASPADYRHALRDVVRACIFGVDRNPMAVELCKVALWIEALEPGKPLTFLDSHIRCGDSLIGVFDINVLGHGIPDDAFKQLPGDEKNAASHYRAKNNREVREREKIESGLGLAIGHTELSKAFAGLQGRPEDSLEDIEAKRRLFDGLIARDGPTWKLKTACDLWTAAWFVPKTRVPIRGRELAPTSGQVWEYLRGITLYGPLIAETDRCAHTQHFFHWPVEFPDIIANGGFDIVIGNPPWERVEVQEQEFFATSHPAIASAQNAAKRKVMIEQLTETDPRAFDSWRAALRNAAVEVAFFKTSERFPLGSPGKVNTYAIFADLFRQLIRPSGQAGLILPNGLVTGYTYRDFLRYLLSTKTLVSFYGFENEDKLFKSVHNETKFGLLTVTGAQHPVVQPWFTAHIRQPEQISDSARRYALTIDEIEAINPNTLNLPAFRWAKDAEITAAIHKSAPVLVRYHSDEAVESPWQVQFKIMFNMATDSGDFLDHQDIAPLIVERRGALAILKDGRQVYPLYEGKMLWQFDHRYGTYEGQTEKQANKGVLPRVSDAQHDDPKYRIEPRYWVDSGLTSGALADDDTYEWFFAWRDVGISERTFIGTIIPKTAAGDKSPILVSPLPAKSRAALVACLSSLATDYSARQKAMNMKYFVVEQIPVPPPSALSSSLSWLGGSPEDWLADRVLELCYTNEELAPFAADLGRDHPPFRWQAERRVVLQAEIDAALLHLYGLNRTQAEWLLDSFAVLRKYEESDLGEFRTKRLVLEIYDEIAKAKQTNQAYPTRLNPFPADPSCCHAPKTKTAVSSRQPQAAT